MPNADRLTILFLVSPHWWNRLQRIPKPVMFAAGCIREVIEAEISTYPDRTTRELDNSLRLSCGVLLALQ